jgi:hypothetical protein
MGNTFVNAHYYVNSFQTNRERRKEIEKESEGQKPTNYFGASVTAAAGAATVTAGAVEVGMGFASFSSPLTG